MPGFPVAALPDGPLDIVGDVHGELEALERLLARLGYSDGRHPEGRRLVFVGDLVDRGHDSVGVLERVMPWVAAGHASCILGNHELNLLTGERKPGNGWWFGEAERWRHGAWSGEYGSALATEALRERALAFFRGLPLVLERSDLRVVHAAWAPAAAAGLEGLSSAAALPAFDAASAGALAADRAADEDWQEERRLHPSLLTAEVEDSPPRLPRHGAWAYAEQQRLPHKLLTSGGERPLGEDERPFQAGGKWRMARRHRWWEDYSGDKPVVVGHYWRVWDEVDPPPSLSRPADAPPREPRTAWLGPRGRVYCVDFSVGLRFQARSGYGREEQSRLAALRWDGGPPRLFTDRDEGALIIEPPGCAR